MAIFTGQAATNNTFIGTGVADTFNFNVADLTSGDTLTGNGGTDTLVLTGAGAVSAASLAGMTSVEALTFGNGGISVSFSNAVATANGGILAVTGSSGNDTLDYSAVTLATRSFNVVAGAGNDVLRGGAGNDVFRFAATLLTSADTVQGGGGAVDQLIFETAGTVAVTSLANVGGIERVILANGTNDITLTAAMGASALNNLIQVFGGTGNDRISATQLTGGARVDVTAGAGLDTLLGSGAQDIFRFTGADLAGDTVNGGGDYDALTITTADAITAADLALVSNIEQINLNASGISLTLNNAVAAANAGVLAVFGSSGNDFVDASAVTTTRALSVTANAGNDTLRGGTGNDAFRFNAADLTAADTVSGGGGAGIDAINFQTAGTITAANLAGVSGIERLALAVGTNAVTITNALVSTASGSAMTIFTSSGDDTVDGSALTGTNKLEIYAGLGNDTLRGGAGADVFRFSVTGLDGSDVVAGGAGFDQLIISTSGALTTAKLAQVSGIDQIVFSIPGASLTLNNAVALANAASLAVFGSVGNDTVDASAVTDTTRGLSITALAGNDNFRGGLGTDVFRFNAADLTSLDTVQGGGGYDQLTLMTSGVLAADALAGVSRIEQINLAAGGNSITLLNANYDGARRATIEDARIFIIGSAASDFVDARALDGSLGSNNIDVTAGAGLDTLLGGADRDVFRFAAQNLAGDTVSGGRGIDTLMITTAGTLAPGALANMTGIDRIFLAAGGNALVLTEANVPLSNDAGYIEVFGGAGNDSVDASGFTGMNSVLLFTAGAGRDTAIGGEGIDVFYFAAADLTADDTITGGGGSDYLMLTTAGLLASNALAGMTGVEAIGLADGTNTLTLRDSNFSGLSTPYYPSIIVKGGTGNDTIDGSTLTGTNAIEVTAGGGLDVLLGSSGTDRFLFAAADLNGDTISGSAGFDRLELTTPGILAADALANMSGVEAVSLADGANAITLKDANFAGGVLRIRVAGSSGSDTVDGSGLSAAANRIAVFGGGGTDILKGGAGADLFLFAAGALDGDTISGGANLDLLQLTTVGTITAAALAGMTGVEAIQLAYGTNSITLANGNFTDTLNSAITVYGNAGDDSIDGAAGGAGNALLLDGGSGLDTLKGGSGADTLTGGADADTLTGNAGADRFVWNNIGEGGDTITDFVRGQDKLVFSALPFGFTGENFDVAIAYDASSAGQNFTAADLILTDLAMPDAQDALDFLNSLPTMPSGPLFMTARGMNSASVLYYIEGGLGVAFQIADLGLNSAPLDFGLSDFVFL